MFETQPAVASPPLAWFCLRSQPKREHFAAGHLRQIEGVEVFLPRIRFKRSRRQGPVWVTEALFPNYLFARFCWKTSLRIVNHAPGVSGVVHFGSRWPTVLDAVMDELHSHFANDAIHVIPDKLSPGDAVRISGGVFHGLTAVITRVLPARERVAVLLEFLGRQTAAELPRAMVIRQANERDLLS